MFLFVRLLPMISIFEMRTLVPEGHMKGAGSIETDKARSEDADREGH
jgi:hypothetical protein